jgi:predicted  nucleic acid-binding Zn-ribbon protein
VSGDDIAQTKAGLEAELREAKEREKQLREKVRELSKLFGDVSGWLFAAAYFGEPGMESELERLEAQIADNFNDYIKAIDISAADRLKDELEAAVRQSADLKKKIDAYDQ